MAFGRKVMVGGAALAVGVGVLALTGVGVASAKKSSAATGTVSCTAVKGSISFKPPLVSTGPYVSETALAKISIGTCTGSVTTPKKGTIKEDLGTITTDQCPPPTTTGGSLTVKWAPGSIEPSVVGFTGHQSGTGGPDNGDGFVYPNSGGSGSVSGSFPGTDNGKTSTAAVYSNLSQTALLSQCASAKGLKKMTIVGGSIDLK